MAGEILAVVGTTGSGKSMLIADIEQWADGETPSQRRILINQIPAAEFTEDRLLRGMAAEVSQNMNFVIDLSVKDFLFYMPAAVILNNRKCWQNKY